MSGAYDEGFDACQSKKGEHNPYHWTTKEHDHWQDGFSDAYDIAHPTPNLAPTESR